MCGIVGYTGARPVVDILIQGLRRLEYRGYDSSGISVLLDGRFETLKSEGRLQNVEALLTARLETATCGIGHTRWATHGKPTTQNAHPHQVQHVVLVHNGIIENYQEIRDELVSRGHKPRTETDSELFGFLVVEEMARGAGLTEAVRKCFALLEGACSIVIMSEREPGVVVGVRNGSPLVVASDPKGGALFASDAQPLLAYTKDVYYLEHGDVAVASPDGSSGKTTLRFLELKTGREVSRKTTRLDWSVEAMDKQGFAHFMLKEINEQPAAMVDTLNAILDRAQPGAFSFASAGDLKPIVEAKELVLVACGTAWHAALLGKYWLERIGKMRVTVELASEFRYRGPVLRPGTVVVAISQSGETADTLAAVREAKSQGVYSAAITNSRGSSISREADAVFYTAAGPEIGVAATKTFTTQMLVLLLLSGALAAKRAKTADETAKVQALFEDLIRIPHLLAEELAPDSTTFARLKKISEKLSHKKGFFFIGRGYSFPIALEGALKLKEISYLHAEGYAAGELKHGPIAMIDREMAVVVLAPKDAWRDKTVSNLEEVKARGAEILGIGDPSDSRLESLCDHWMPLTSCGAKPIDECLYPLLLTPVIQVLSYEIALLKGTDVDKPRNLAKSVTVE